MTKFTDLIRDGIKADFNTGDQPTQADFHDWIDAIQQGIEEHDHSGTGDGDGVNNLVGPVGIGCAPGANLEVRNNASGSWVFLTTDAGGVNLGGIYEEPAGDATFLFYDAAGAVTVKLRTDGATSFISGSLGIGLVVGVAGQLHVKSVDGSAIPTLVLEQLDVSEGTINFAASERGIITGATNSVQSVRIELNGTVYRLAVYANA